MTPQMDLETQKARYYTLAKYGFVFLACAAVAPLALTALEGLYLILAFIVTLVLAFNFAPVVGAWIANKRIQALTAVIEANPIETMKNLYAEKLAELRQADENITAFDAEIRDFDDQVRLFSREYPEEAPTYTDLSQRMHEGLKGMQQQQSFARGELEKFKMSITKAEAIYRMSTAAKHVAALSKSAEAEVFSAIKEKVAFDTVRRSLNQAFANLDLALERRKDAVALTPPAPKALAVPTEPLSLNPAQTVTISVKEPR